jgi:hypothetical protein
MAIFSLLQNDDPMDQIAGYCIGVIVQLQVFSSLFPSFFSKLWPKITMGRDMA